MMIMMAASATLSLISYLTAAAIVMATARFVGKIRLLTCHPDRKNLVRVVETMLPPAFRQAESNNYAAAMYICDAISINKPLYILFPRQKASCIRLGNGIIVASVLYLAIHAWALLST